jgi:hypothetical protein
MTTMEPTMSNPEQLPTAPTPLESLPDAVAEEAPPTATAVNYALAGEALAAVTGLFPQDPITPAQGLEAEGVPADLEQQIARFCQFRREPDKFRLAPKVDFAKTWARLQPLTNEELRVTDGLRDPQLVAAWANTVDAARAHARSLWPLSIRQTPTGPDWLEPSRTEGGMAEAVLLVLDDPRELLRELNRHSMTPSQVEAVKTAYPELFGRILVVFDVALKAAGQAGKKCPWGHEVLLRRLFGVAPTGLVTFGPQDGAPPRPARVAIKFDELKTRNQAVQ